jgi:Zn-dependent M28 family amino/carboxypeptidase
VGLALLHFVSHATLTRCCESLFVIENTVIPPVGHSVRCIDRGPTNTDCCLPIHGCKVQCRFLTVPPRFDMMGKRLYKVYKDITNIVVRISDGTPASKEHAVLVNAHLDSTLPSPGAADDALSVGVMLECMRVLVGTPGWSPTWSIIFCELDCLLLLARCKFTFVYKVFNHAEESLQDGSHLFSTQHETRHTSVY